MIEEIRHKFNRLTFYTILFTFLGVSMTFIIFSSVASPTLTCPSGQFVNTIGTATDLCGTPINGPIAFDKALVVNDTTHNVIGISTLTSATFTTTVNETIVVSAVCYAGCNATSISDTQLNTFTFIAEQRSTPANDTIDAWWVIPLAGSDQITVNWSVANYNFFEIALYKNSKGVGSPVGKIDQVSFKTSITITASGAWAIGVGGTGSAIGDPNCQALFPRAGSNIATVRVNSCAFINTSGPSSGFIADNATALQNGLAVSFGVDAIGQTCGPYVCLGIEFEVLPTDLEPNIVPPTPYTLNSVKMSTGINVLNQVLALGQVYCTGITTPALTTTGTHTILMNANYGGVSLNQSGAKMLVQLKIGLIAPATVFGVGVCAGGGSVTATMDLTFTLSGALSATFAYSDALNGSPTPVAGIYYAWLEITPQNFVGHMSYDQVVNQAYCFASLFMQEQK